MAVEKNAENNQALLKISQLVKHFHVSGGFLERMFGQEDKYVHAVDGINLEVTRGDIFGLVGESGCGKTTTARILNGLETPTSGKFYWKGDEITHDDLKPKKIDVKSQFVFQDPYSSLNPRMRIGDLVQHPLVVQDRIENEDMKRKIRQVDIANQYGILSFILFFVLYVLTYVIKDKVVSDVIFLLSGALLASGVIIFFYFGYLKKKEIIDPQVITVLKKVGLSPPEQYYTKYPHELSGGERQRVNIARAIILNPELLILDEPTSMLDVSLRAGILQLLEDIKEEFDISILFITHDLATARHFCNKVGVMYVGEIVETGETDDLFKRPLHPYTKSLLDAIPSPKRKYEDRLIPEGDVADSISPPKACRFNPRCPLAQDKCRQVKPVLEEKVPGRWVACHFPILD